MNKAMKKHLNDVVEAIVNEDTIVAREAFHQYLSLKTHALLVGESMDDDEDDEKDDKKVDKEDKKVDKDIKKVKDDEKKAEKDHKKVDKDINKLEKDQKKDDMKDDDCK